MGVVLYKSACFYGSMQETFCASVLKRSYTAPETPSASVLDAGVRISEESGAKPNASTVWKLCIDVEEQKWVFYFFFRSETLS